MTAFDYWDARGSIDFDFWKYFTLQFGYDKNFIGNGYRTLFLSDYAAPYLFLKLNLRIWKLNYQNILMELISQHLPGDYLLSKKICGGSSPECECNQMAQCGFVQQYCFWRSKSF